MIMYQNFSQFQKKQFGTLAENHVSSLLEKLSEIPCLRCPRRIFDLEWNGNRIEVKSAQLCRSGIVTDGRYNYHGFTTYQKQVSSMLKHNGFFAFVLMVADEVIAVKFASAKETVDHIVRYGKGYKMRIKMGIFYDGISPKRFVGEHLTDRYLP